MLRGSPGLAGRKIIVLVLVAALVAGCSSGDGGGDGDRAADRPTSTSTTEVPAPDVRAAVVEVPDLAGEGAEPRIAQVSSVNDRTYAVGSTQSLRDGRFAPLVIRRDAAGWTPVPVDLPPDAVGAEAVAAVSVRGRLVVYGTSSAAPGTGRGDDLVAWAPEEGPAPLEIEGPGVGDGDQLVGQASAGRAGVLLAGQDEGEAVLWSSADGTEFRAVSVPDGAVRSVHDVAVGAEQAVAVGYRDATSVLLSADLDEGTAAVVHELPADGGSITAVRAVAGGFLLGGGDASEDGDERPTLWASDGTTWPGEARQLPETDEAGTSNSGYPVRDLDLRDGKVVASYGFAVAIGPAGGGGPWEITTSEGLPDTARPSDVALGTHGDVAVRVLHGRKLVAYDGARWADGASDVLPVPATLEEPAGIAHRDGRWILATTVSLPDDTSAPQVWWSDDGSSWTRSEALPGAGDARVDAVGRSSDGFVVAGVRHGSGDAGVWRSTDGVAWTEVSSPLLVAEDGGVRQATRIVERPDGAMLTGFRFDGSAIHPYALQIGTDGSVTDTAPPPGSRPDTATLALCEHEGEPVLAGGVQDTTSRVAWWTRRAEAWTIVETDVSGSVWSCASVGDRILGFATTPDGPLVGELGSDFAGTALPGPGTFDVSDVVVAETGPVVFGAGSGDVWIWLGDPDVVPDADGWTLVRPEALGGVGAQYFAGAAAGEDGRLLVALRDGVRTRLVEVELPA